MSALEIAGIAALFLAVMAAMWCGILALLAHSGWSDLASHYPRDGEESGRRYGFTSGWVHAGRADATYAACLVVKVGREGVGVAAGFPFTFRHPPLFIPWAAVKACDDGESRGVRLRMRATPTVIGFHGRAAAAVHEQWLAHRAARRR